MRAGLPARRGHVTHGTGRVSHRFPAVRNQSSGSVLHGPHRIRIEASYSVLHRPHGIRNSRPDLPEATLPTLTVDSTNVSHQWFVLRSRIRNINLILYFTWFLLEVEYLVKACLISQQNLQK